MKRLMLIISLIFFGYSVMCQPAKTQAESEDALLRSINWGQDGMFSFGFGNFAGIVQIGEANNAAAVQSKGKKDDPNSALIVQNGDENNAVVVQKGTGISSLVLQNGNENACEIKIEAPEGAESSVNQNGRGNYVEQDLESNQSFTNSVTQIGNNHYLLQKEGDGTMLDYTITQTGNGANAVITNGKQ